MINSNWRPGKLAGRLRKAYFAGWLDAKLRLGWSSQFDTDASMQAFYEHGRLDRCNVELAGIDVVWDGEASGVDEVLYETWRADGLVGPAAPPHYRGRISSYDR